MCGGIKPIHLSYQASKIKNFINFLTILIILLPVAGQNKKTGKETEIISREGAKAVLNFLASDWMEGRKTGTKGNSIAADYLASMFQLYGLKPVVKQDPFAKVQNMYFPNNEYFQNFGIIQYTPSDAHKISVLEGSDGKSQEERFNYKTDFISGDFTGIPTKNIKGKYPVVFVGYGIDNEKTGYNDYKNLDVKGKIVIRLRGFPGHMDTASAVCKKFNVKRKNMWQYMNFEYDKNEAAQKRGAVACLEFDSQNEAMIYTAGNIFRFNQGQTESDEPIADTFEFLLENSSGDDIPGFTISRRLANKIFEGSGIDISEFENNVKNSLKSSSSEIKNKNILFETATNSSLLYGRNILGAIEGENKDEVVVVGAHFDHLGKKQGTIWNGADDNASGVAAVLEIARAIKEKGIKPQRTILFALWDAEETGLLGSTYFMKHPEGKKIFANVNFDMISRNAQDDSLGINCYVTYSDSCEVFKTNTEKFIKDENINLNITYSSEADKGIGTDSDSFGAKGISVITFDSGMHKDYHRPTDSSEKANIKKMTDIIKLGYLHVWELANSDKNKLK